MSPPQYIKARENGVEKVKIDGQFYMPLLKVDCDNDESIVRVVVELLELPNETSSMTVTKISGGITNQLYKVTYHPNTNTNQQQSILVRVFGAEGMIDRDIENSTYAALSKSGLAPRYHGRFSNGRLEEWLEARPLSVRELANYSTPIAQQLARFHSTFEIPDYLRPYHSSDRVSLWTQLDTWMQQALSSTFQTKHDSERASLLQLELLQHEIQDLHSTILSTHNSPISFCHNDVLSANILLKSDDNIQLIDFEYGGMNYRAFDIANHWNEYAGGTDTGVPHYEWFPTEKQQHEFVEAYLTAYYQDSGGETPTRQEITEFQAQIHAFVLVNHLYWGLWAVNQAAMEGCRKFDYLLYATNRIHQYYKCKQEQEASMVMMNGGV